MIAKNLSATMIAYNYFALCGLFPALTFAIYLYYSCNKLPYPPGPTPIPLLGNLLQVPRRYSMNQFLKWKDIYGPIYHFRIFGRRFIMLNNLQVAADLLEKRSAIHSSRPTLPMARLAGRDKTALFLPAGIRWKETRKLMATFLGPRSEEFYLPIIEEETYRFLRHLQSDPENFFTSLRSFQASIILKIVYGYQLDYEGDYFLQLAENLSTLTTEATDPGRWLVDSFPSIQHLPFWLPGMGFKTWAREARMRCEASTRAPFEFVKSSMINGQFLPSFTSSQLHRLPQADTEAEEILMYASASIYSGGTDTTVSAIKLFFLMMTLHPDVQARAQSELDLLVCGDRAPRISDLPSLPYISCIIKELLRFNPPVPLTVHSPVRDDVYDGFLIPKGAWVIGNVWSMSHDPLKYPDPHKFRPERFDKSSGSELQPDPLEFTFGFGRRVCPGQHITEKTLFMVIASVLWAFNITPEMDASGRPLPPDIAFSSGHTVHPKPFRCRIQPRSTQPMTIIDSILQIG